VDGTVLQGVTIGGLMLAATLAGFVDAIAGGGGLITLPALLLTGLSPAEAIATNKLQGTFGVASASRAYYRAGAVDGGRPLRLAVAATATGAALGAYSVSQFDATTLSTWMPWALSAVAAYFALMPYLRRHLPHAMLSAPAFALIGAAPVGFYDGFFGPGAGSLYTLAFVALAGASLLGAMAHAKLLNFTSNVVSLGVFLAAGHIHFSAGLPMAVGQIAGAWAGSHIALKHGAFIIRPMLVAITLATAARLWLAG